MASLDSSFVPIAFSDMIDKLDTSTSVVVWVALGYLIAATGPMLLLARVADTIGRARMFALGTLVYGSAMIACGYAPDVFTLVIFRLIQGFGMAMFLPTTFTIATEMYPPEQRGKALGLLASGNAFGFILGPVFAGWLLDAYDWRALFISRIPFAILAVVMAFSVFGKTVGRATRKRDHYDITGAFLLTLSLFCLLFGFNRLPVEENYLDLTVWAVFVGGIILFPLFIRQERKSPDPLVDIDLFRKNQSFTRASIAFSAMFASFPVYLFVLPILLMVGLEIRPWTVGMIMAVVAVITFLISPQAGKLADKIGAEKVSTVGASLTMTGYLLMFIVQVDTSGLTLLLPMVIIGIGTGLFFSPNNSIIMANAPPERQAMASGLIGTFRQTGYALGFAVIASLFTMTQDMFEESWTVVAVDFIPVNAAEEITLFFEQGGIWSPEVLLYIFKVTTILCAAMLLITVLYSMPWTKSKKRFHLLASGSAAAAALSGILIFSSVSSLKVTPDVSVVESLTPQSKIIAFGVSRRTPVSTANITGEMLYLGGCAQCHGEQMEGKPLLGVSLVGNQYVRQSGIDGLVEHIRKGRPVTHPENTSGRPMPSFKGVFSKDEIYRLAEYVIYDKDSKD
jgi:EmrB/QacA subfamily drug resistance transporter|tara:strand:+ start:33452 stop:35320 length:1869 start_codon:yes stop_codon:yes gene_type:complete